MFERLMSFLGTLPSTGSDIRLDADDPRVAAAALCLHVMDADGVRTDAERGMLAKALTGAWDIDEEELARIISAGEKAEQEAVDLYAFTSVLMRHLDEDQRLEFVAVLWQIVYADGEFHELEDNIVWRVAELIAVDRRARVELRTRASGREPLLAGDPATEIG